MRYGDGREVVQWNQFEMTLYFWCLGDDGPVSLATERDTKQVGMTDRINFIFINILNPWKNQTISTESGKMTVDLTWNFQVLGGSQGMV